ERAGCAPRRRHHRGCIYDRAGGVDPDGSGERRHDPEAASGDARGGCRCSRREDRRSGNVDGPGCGHPHPGAGGSVKAVKPMRSQGERGMTTTAANKTDALLPVYRQGGPVFVAGEGSHLIAENGRRYLDFTSGIAVNALGYGDPAFTAAVTAALDSGLVHTSNLFRTRPAAELA